MPRLFSHGHVPFRSRPKSGAGRGCVHMGMEKNQTVRSRRRYGKVNQKLERYEQKSRSSLGPLSGHV